MFNPESAYHVRSENNPIRDFHAYADDYVVRPPYQRKSVWSRKKKQALLDSLFRRYYVPRLVIREVRLGENQTKQEVIDGQQRIITVQAFFRDELPLPKSLGDVDPFLPGKRYGELSAEHRKFVDKSIRYDVDIVTGIEDPRNPDHQRVATEIFWRLQQGENLTFMEVAHARLNSLARNFVVKYADDITFDYEDYEPRDENPDKHSFFSIIDRNNNRMQHLALLTRLLLLEEGGGPADIRDVHVMEYIDRHLVDDGVGNMSFESHDVAKATLRNMGVFYEVFKDDAARGEKGGPIPEMRVEYFIVSVYLLIRHIHSHYVFGEGERSLLQSFVHDFYGRWRSARDAEADRDLLVFSDNRQQTAPPIEVRDRILRQHFFRFSTEQNHELLAKDDRRAFNETERIAIYRRDDGMCQQCLAEGKDDKEARVEWRQYEADHVLPHSKGGMTTIENAQLLCRYHNQKKGATVVS